MALSAGTRLGPYEIVSAIAAGGMGEVYRARDPRLGRDVAIKALPDLSVADSEHVGRFQREAQILAALNHPHIAALYGLEEANGSQFLILELVEGDTLGERLKAGPLPLTEALTIARQVADALEAAHEKGIIHRDLKPANIALTTDGQVKVLDFGLAKTLEPDISKDMSNSPTLAATQSGVILGTAAYMSPEQTRGRPLDKRADIWAFGCVQYEMLTGRRPFAGQTTSDAIAAILGQEPDWAALPAVTPVRVQWLMRRCLEKDPKRRLHDIADARIELDEALREPHEAGHAAPAVLTAPVVARGRARERVAWITAGVCLLALIVALAFGWAGVPGRPVGDNRPYTASIVLPEGLRFAGPPAGRFALSPDGRGLAFVASDASGQPMLWVRPLDTVVARPLAGTDGAEFPFWSPDSRFVAFLAQGKLKKVEVSGGASSTLCDASFGATGAWNRDDVILFTPKGESALYRVSASGGTPSPATTLDAASGDTQHMSPFFLPDGLHFLYFALGSKTGGVADPRGVYVGSLDPGEPGKLLVQGGSNAQYAQGHLIFLRGSTLVAQAFDVSRLELGGEATPLTEQTQISNMTGTVSGGAFTVSEDALAYQTVSSAVRSQLVWFDRAGKQIAVLGDQADYRDVSLSPDSARVAVSRIDPERGTHDLFIYDVLRGLRERFTVDSGDEWAPSWSPDGGRLFFSARRQASVDLYQKASNGTGREDVLLEAGLGKYQASSSPDGRLLLYVAGGGAIGRSDLWVLPLSGDRKPFPFLETPFIETQGQFSPDGLWVAYASGERPGQLEVYVTPFPGPGAKWRVSTAGGSWPRWRRDGKEIFYLASDNTLIAAIVTGQASGFDVGAVRPLFRVSRRPMVRLDAYPYDVSSDGQRFLVNTLVEDATSTAITLVVNWTTGLKK